MTYGEQDEGDVFDDVSTSLVADAHQRAPTPPVLALRHAVLAPAAERFIQVEFPFFVDITADAGLQVSHPVTRNVDPCRNTTNSNTCRDKDEPYLAGIRENSQLSEDSRRVC